MNFKVFLSSLIAIVMVFTAVSPSVLYAEEAVKEISVTENSEDTFSEELQTPTYEEVINLENNEVEIIAKQAAPATIEQLSEYYNTNLENINIDNFDEKFEFLTSDSVFNEMEEIIAIQEAEAQLSQDEVNAQWVPVVAAALRALTSKAGKKAMEKGWSVARPHIEKALKNLDNYVIDGPSGGRIIQVRNKKTKQPIFRLDYHYIDGKGPYLHYHVAPNMERHHFIW